MSEKYPPLSLLPTLRRAVLVLIFVFLLFPTTSTSAQTNATLSGRVTNSKGEPIPDVGVVLYDERDYFSNRDYVTTNANGEYSFTDISPDTYYIRFAPSSIVYRDEFYNNQSSIESADGVVVTAGATLTGYDAVLPNSGRIVGIVTNVDEVPIADVEVRSYYDNNLEYSLQDTTATDSSGVFTIAVRYDNPHFLYFLPNEDYFAEYFDGKEEIDDAAPFVVGAEETITVAVTLSRSHTISGTVVDGHGIPVANVDVHLENYDWDDWRWQGDTTTDANGRYKFEHLPRDYRYLREYKFRLRFSGPTIIDEYYGDTEIAEEADIIDLTNGPDIFVANAEVSRQGVVTGTVIDANGAPIEDVAVRFKVFSPAGWRTNVTVNTDANGNYEMPYGIPEREYRVEFDTDAIYVTEFYSNSYSVETAQSITIPFETTIPNINAQLDRYGVITGTVTNLSNQPLSQVTVQGYDMELQSATGTSDLTDDNGYYEISVPPERDVNVGFSHATHEAEFYDDQPSISTATALSVPLNSTLPNINAQLAAGSVISGTVTDSNGALLEGITVAVLDSEGFLKTTVLTDENGHYSIGLASGMYRLGFNNYGNQTDNENYVGEYYENASTPAESTPITLTFGNDLTINAELTVIPGISGHVTNQNGQPAYADVSLLTRAAPGGEWQCCAYTTSTYQGYYSFRNIDPGEYVVSFTPDPFIGLYSEYYPNQRTAETATILTITPSSLFTGIDAALDEPGKVVGTVVNSENEPLSGIEVTVHWQRTFTGDDQWPSVRTTDENGQFVNSTGETPIYFVFKDPTRQYAGEWFDNQPNLETATAITGTRNTTRTIQIELGQSASITGRVTNISGEPLGNVLVLPYTYWPQHHIPLQYEIGIHAYTDANGNYRLDGLTPSTKYRVRFGYQEKSYFYPDAMPVADAEDGSNGEDVVITEGLLLSNLNMALFHPSEVLADFSGTPRIGTGAITVNFTDESVGPANKWLWDFGDGATSTQPAPSHTYTTPGTYTVTLTITGTMNSDVEKKVSYISLADTPIAEVSIQQSNSNGSPQSQPKVGETIYFSATAAGSNVEYLWDFGDGALAVTSTATGQYVQHSYDAPGNYTVTLTARNGVDEKVTTMQLTIRDKDDEEPNGDVPVSALALHGPNNALVNALITLSATVGAGDNVTYTWDFGDGESGMGQTIQHAYSEAETYTITLTASNGVSEEVVTREITIQEAEDIENVLRLPSLHVSP